MLPQEEPSIVAVSDAAVENNTKPLSEIKFPQAADRKIVQSFRVTADGLFSTRAQTDSTPLFPPRAPMCLTA